MTSLDAAVILGVTEYEVRWFLTVPTNVCMRLGLDPDPPYLTYEQILKLGKYIRGYKQLWAKRIQPGESITDFLRSLRMAMRHQHKLEKFVKEHPVRVSDSQRKKTPLRNRVS